MTDATAKFFESLERRGHEPLLEKATGTLRVDLRTDHYTEHWTIHINRGDLSVSREQRDAEAVVGSSPELFERLVRGEENAVAAMLRGDMTVFGNLQLILRVERLFPGPPDARGPRRGFGKGR
ncbi:SCP2 sterol-binding domain-containing protein [Micromonospora sp. NPDC049559]|uniref:SCP2 sterol-binding domain-containing protein n=1 Tax=Micromonospora sp. NPDC049559 TaxID=3155923 RepID=UPI003420037A